MGLKHPHPALELLQWTPSFPLASFPLHTASLLKKVPRMRPLKDNRMTLFLGLNFFNHFRSHSRGNQGPVQTSGSSPTFPCPGSHSHLPLHIPQVSRTCLSRVFAGTAPSAQIPCPDFLQAHLFTLRLGSSYVSYHHIS